MTKNKIWQFNLQNVPLIFCNFFYNRLFCTYLHNFKINAIHFLLQSRFGIILRLLEQSRSKKSKKYFFYSQTSMLQSLPTYLPYCQSVVGMGINKKCRKEILMTLNRFWRHNSIIVYGFVPKVSFTRVPFLTWFLVRFVVRFLKRFLMPFLKICDF